MSAQEQRSCGIGRRGACITDGRIRTDIVHLDGDHVLRLDSGNCAPLAVAKILLRQWRVGGSEWLVAIVHRQTDRAIDHLQHEVRLAAVYGHKQTALSARTNVHADGQLIAHLELIVQLDETATIAEERSRFDLRRAGNRAGNVRRCG